MEGTLGSLIPRTLTARQREAEREKRWAKAMSFAKSMASGTYRKPDVGTCEMEHVGNKGPADSCLWRCKKCGELSFGYGDGSPLEECPSCHAKVTNKVAQLRFVRGGDGELEGGMA